MNRKIGKTKAAVSHIPQFGDVDVNAGDVHL